MDAIAAVRDGGAEPGPFVSLDDFCRRVDLHTINRRVIESLIKSSAMASLGTAGSLLEALDAALENGARHQRDVAAGQSTLFDLFALPAEAAGSAFLDGGEEIPRRERLRWEKELIGLYLSEHPLGDIAGVLPEYVTAYTGELADEEDQAKVTLGGIILSSRRVITRAGSTMLVATLEDLQGSVEVVVFPRVFEETGPSWVDDSVVLVTGRIDRRDETPQLLCEAVHQWDDAVRMGPVAFGAERDRLLAAGRGGRRWAGQNGNGNGHANGNGGERVQGVWGSGSETQPVAVEPEAPSRSPLPSRRSRPWAPASRSPPRRLPLPPTRSPSNPRRRPGRNGCSVHREEVPTERLRRSSQ